MKRTGKTNIERGATKNDKNKKQKKEPGKTNKKKDDNVAAATKKPPPAVIVAERHVVEDQEFDEKTLHILQTLPFDFPPTLYSNVEYTNGICIPRNEKMSGKQRSTAAVADNEDDSNGNYMNAFYARISKANNNIAHSPLLPQADLWSHKFAAQEAAKDGSTMTVFRLLGTITRTITSQKALPKVRRSQAPNVDIRNSRAKRTKCTKMMAKKEALLEQELLLELDGDNINTTNIDERTSEIQAAWNAVWSPNDFPRQWDSKYGNLLPYMVNDSQYVPLQKLLEPTKWKYTDDDAAALKKGVHQYPGLPSLPAVAIDTPTVLKHLAELQSPEGLYQIPLVLTYPRLILLDDNGRPKQAAARRKKKESKEQEKTSFKYKLEIGVYANRLLLEVLLERKLLQTIMAALDEGSYIVKEPLHMPPVPSTPKFASAEYPKLVFDTDEDDDDDELIADENGVIDLTLEGTTRNSGDVLSAFTTPGLLKLWENTGTDTSEWPKLQSMLQKHLSMPLLLHQQDAVCWMRSMEHLEGFGINSILWEERSWWDGSDGDASYYYSPALGQIRLDRPSTMHGGILADEMGLGKTIMILALIVTTLDDLKEIAMTSNGSRHTTLIIVPPALLGQWRSEITKAAPQLRVQIYNTQTCSYDVDDDTVDICLATYPALERGRSSKTSSLQDSTWGRIVLDEMQEVRSPTTQIAKACCDLLRGNRRWMLSGTPLFDGITDLCGELNFLSLEPYAAKSEDGFFDFSITDHWEQHSILGLEMLQVLGLLLLRRSKNMTICASGSPLMGLKPLTVEFVPIAQSPAERALYCFLEYIVAHQLQSDIGDAAGPKTKKKVADHRFCLRLLRDLCISPTLLSGGLGVTSELTKLNHLVMQYNRHSVRHLGAETAHMAEDQQHQNATQQHLSCTQAIRYLSQVQARVQTAEDFVSDLQLGAGGGMAKRNRATKSIEEQVKDSRELLTRATKKVKMAQSTKAKSHWHWALEQITTGAIGHAMNGVVIKSSITALWCSRAAVLQRDSHNEKIPTILERGWRPSSRFIKHDLYASNPEFFWAHPVAMILNYIPKSVTDQELGSMVAETLEHGKFKIIFGDDRSRATLQLHHPDDAKKLSKKAKRGIPVKTSTDLPLIEDQRKECEAAYSQAKNENDVFPTIETRRNVKQTKHALLEAQRGLLVLFEPMDKSSHIHLSDAKGPSRSLLPKSAEILFSNLQSSIEIATEILAENVVTVENQSKLLVNLERAADVPEEVKQMSAFESLESMQLHEYDKTFCCICMGVLGSSDPRCTNESEPGLVALTPCGHLFCTKCMHDCIGSAASSQRQPQCPSCRKDVSRKGLVHINPSLSSNLEKAETRKRAKAKTAIQKAAKMLEESNGQLDPDMWLQLFLSIDLPTKVSLRGDNRLPAIPKEVIAFFRAASGFHQVHNRGTELPNVEPMHGLSSKMQALLRDLPSNERSVVFTTSSASIKHLMAIFDYHSVAHREVFSGQNPSDAQIAVQAWKSAIILEASDEEEKKEPGHDAIVVDNPLVLIVQAGAAASGLTLTAACKMFFLEPFVRQEEEQQAYARCHRYGQIHAVHAKVYFTPVSVEARLLEWRKQEKSAMRGSSDTKVVYSDIMEVDDSDDEKVEMETEEDDDDVAIQKDEEDTDQTRFLLGLE